MIWCFFCFLIGVGVVLDVCGELCFLIDGLFGVEFGCDIGIVD